MTKTRILHCMESIASGGVEQRRLSLIRHLPTEFYEHRIICTKAVGPIGQELRERGVVITELGTANASIFRPYRYRVAMEIIREWRPHVVHGAVIDGYTLGCVAGRLAGVKAVIMEETSDPAKRNWKAHRLVRLMARLSCVCVAVSPSLGKYFLTELKLDPKKVRVINNGVDMPVIIQGSKLDQLRQQFGISDVDIVIGSAGRLKDSHKRFSDLISAVSKLPPGLNAKLLIVGDGPDRATLERHAASLGVENKVVFAGYQPIVGHFYSMMDVFALASETEAFGLVLAEAMRCGLPVVATRVGGIPDVVVDGSTGILVPPRQPDELAAALRKFIENPTLRRQFGEAGKSRADDEFSMERYVSDVDELYRQLVGEI